MVRKVLETKDLAQGRLQLIWDIGQHDPAFNAQQGKRLDPAI